MNKTTTAGRGRRVICAELARRGGTRISESRTGSRFLISFLSKDGKTYTIAARAKTAGTWQTMIKYGRRTSEDPNERHFWVFVDLEFEPPKFYPVPESWIANDIFRAHQLYLKKHGGRRKVNDSSKHHAIAVDRIKAWEARWDRLGL